MVTALALSIGLGSAAVVRLRAVHDLLDPLGLFLCSALFYFGLHAVWLVDNPPWGLTPPTEGAYVRAAALIALGVATLIGAYAWWNPRPSIVRGDSRAIPTVALLCLFALGFAVRLYGVKLGAWQRLVLQETTSNLQIVTTISLLSTVAFVVAACQYYRLGRAGRLVLLMGLAQVGFAIAVGRKELILEVALAWVAARHYCFRPISIRVALATILAFVLFFTPLIQSGRNERDLRALPASQQTELTVATLPDRFGALIAHPERALEGLSIIQQRTVGIEATALATDFTPEIRPYEHGKSFSTIPASVVPSFAWPNKPVYDQTVAFSQNYAGVPRGGGLAVGPTIPADLYINFGVVGVVLGFAVIGLILKWLTAWLRFGDTVIAVTLFTLLLPKLLQVDLAVSTLGGYLLINGLLALLVLHALRHLGTRNAEAGSPGHHAVALEQRA